MSRDSCTAIREDLTAFAFGDLAPRRMGEVGMHAGGCAACRAELREIETVLGTASLWEVPEGALSAAPDLPAPGRRRIVLPAPWPRAAAAAAVVLSAVGLWLLARHRPPAPPQAERPPSAGRFASPVSLASISPLEAFRNAAQVLASLGIPRGEERTFLSGRVRGGSAAERGAALGLLAARFPSAALSETERMVGQESAYGAIDLLRSFGIDASRLAPALLRVEGPLDRERALAAAAALLGGGRDFRGVVEALEMRGARKDGETPALRALDAALDARLEAAGSRDVLRAMRRVRSDTAWERMARSLAARGEPALAAELGAAWRSPKRRVAAGEIAGSLPAEPLRDRALDAIAAAWMRGSGRFEELPAGDGSARALGRCLARMDQDGKRRLMERLVEGLGDADAAARAGRCDGVLAAALGASADPGPVLQLVAVYGSRSLAAPVARLRDRPGMRGIVESVLMSIDPPRWEAKIHGV